MKRIEVHCKAADGKTYIMNHLSGENTEAFGGGDVKAKRQKLINHATKMAGDWATTFPNDRFYVAEV